MHFVPSSTIYINGSLNVGSGLGNSVSSDLHILQGPVGNSLQKTRNLTMYCILYENACTRQESACQMRFSRVVRASDSQCRRRNCPGFDPSILRHSGI